MRISIVIPALNEARCIERCLRSALHENDPAEIVVVDGGSSDQTCMVAEPFARILNASRGRAVQMNAGAAATTGDVLLFLHADSCLAVGALAAIRSALAAPSVGGGTFTLRFDRSTPMLSVYSWCTQFRWRLFHYGDQGIFVRRTVFEALGGFRELPIMEDVDFLARLDTAGKTVLLPLPVTTSARRFERHGVVRQQLRNAALLGLYSVGVPPTRLARWYENSHR